MNKWLIIGSTAAYHWFPDSAPPKDIDLLTPATVIGNQAKVCIVDSQWHDVAEEIIQLNKDPVFADPDILFTLKVSHAHWDIHWDKTIADVNFFKSKGCKLNMELYHKLVKVWEEVHGKKRVNLNQSTDTFWNDAVARVYDHEHVHECVKFYDRPLHEKIRPVLNNVWCSEAMFDDLTDDHQAETVLEEILVTAIERGRLIESSSKIDRLRAVNRAYKQLVISMSKGWFARYLILNQLNLLKARREQWETQLSKALKLLSSSSKLTSTLG